MQIERTIEYKWAQRARALAFIVESTKQNGYPPSVREIGKHVGISSSSTTYKLLDSMREDELIIVDTKVARSIRVTNSGMALYRKAKSIERSR
jgi:repressor LexA